MWMPIETAPRHDADEGAPHIRYLFYDTNIDFVFEGWASVDGDVWAIGAPFDSSRGWTPTHWMPLPEPPPSPKVQEPNDG